MYGPLVLAGVDLATDIFVPKGSTFRTDPGSFIVRNTSVTTALQFTAEAADGSTVRMVPLRDVMEEQYVVYFMTAGTKPQQPHNGYCPHSRSPPPVVAHLRGASGDLHEDGHEHARGEPGHEPGHVHSDGHGHAHGEEEQALISYGSPTQAPFLASEARGVLWQMDQQGRLSAA